MALTDRKKGGFILLATAAAILLVLFYGHFDPEQSRWMPHCLFLSLTGLECPGCGSQRALHALLNGDVAAAWTYNPLVIILTPLSALLIYSNVRRQRYPRLHRALNSPAAILTLALGVTVWFIIRNFITTK